MRWLVLAGCSLILVIAIGAYRLHVSVPNCDATPTIDKVIRGLTNQAHISGHLSLSAIQQSEAPDWFGGRYACSAELAGADRKSLPEDLMDKRLAVHYTSEIDPNAHEHVVSVRVTTIVGLQPSRP